VHERVGSASPLLLRLREFVGFGHLEPVSVSIVWGVAGLSGMVAGFASCDAPSGWVEPH